MMVVISLIVVVVLTVPILLVIGRTVDVWVPERKRDVVIATGGFGFAMWLVVFIAIVPAEKANLLQKLLVPLIAGCVAAEMGFVLVVVNLFIVDRVTGRFIEKMRSLTPRGASSEWRRRVPFYSLRTPLESLRRDVRDSNSR